MELASRGTAHRWAPVLAVLTVLSVLVVAPAASAAPAPAAQAPDAVCAASVTAGVTAESLPGGRWTVTDGCIPHEAFYEIELAGYRLVLGLAPVTYDDGHQGRIAVASLTAPDGLAASLVGVEDIDTELVRWVYAEGTATVGTDHVEFAGDGLSDVPDEPARLELTVQGDGIDLLSAEDGIAGEVRAIILDAVSTLAG